LSLVGALKKRQSRIHSLVEESWRQKSRATWIKSGDKNTSFFHKYATHRRNINTIWDISDEEGNNFSTLTDIRATTFNHFKSLFSEIGYEDMPTQFNVIKEVPRFFTDEESNEVGKTISIEELKEVIG
jgi:hypothetical protein